MSSANIRVVPKQYSAFNPRVIPGCALWLDAADISSLSLSGTSVTEWKDKSGNERNTNTVTGTPTLTNNSLNGLPGIYFNGSQDMTGPFVYTSNVLTYFIVSTTQSDTQRYSGTFSIGTSGVDDWNNISSMACLARDTLNSFIYLQRNNSFISVTTQTYSTPFLWSGLVNGTNITGFINGTSINSFASTGNFNTSIYSVSSRIPLTASSKNKGFIYEIVAYTAALTTSQRQQIEGYLTQKWGLTTNLPATHPYRSVPLFTRPFLPVDIENCALWLDAADATTITLSGSSVTQWNDKSGNGRNATVPQSSPTYVTNTLNKLPIIRFSNPTVSYNSGYSGQYFSLPIFNFGTTTTRNIFAVITPSATRSFDAGSSDEAVIAWRGFHSGMMVSKGNLSQFQLYTSWWNTGRTIEALIKTNITMPPSSFIAYAGTSCTGSSATASQAINGTLTSSNFAITALDNTYTVLSIGVAQPYSVGNGYNWYYNGDIAEIIIYQGDLTTSQRQQVEGYLAWKWGLQSKLPSGQPFKLFQTPSVLFTPPAISGCSVWFDAMDNSTITLSGSSVTSVKDKAQNITFTTQGTSSLLTLSNAINSRQSLYFDNSAGNSVYLQGTLSNLTRGSAFIVWRAATQLSADYRPLYSWQSTGGLRFPAFGYVSSLTTVAPYTTFGGPGTPTNTVAAGTNYLTFYSWSGTTTSVGFNAATPTAGTQPSYTSSTSTFTIMGEVAGTLYGTTGFVGEMILYNEVLSASQRQQVEGYLAWKWGLQTSVPSSHPFSKLRP